ncbi:hypothetical protein [Paludisphaera mucosa]|uniref:PEP-CTERM protein-sorting domain-containing protein n=1 Tax=Paludisphaera mucosa TaxID=3030827 RepID=A0ABT6F7Q8_9BACT|nr:hypothetical protein [Paludisphaera mucosa]MDG3003572.1 hypothetical protein [Paludisphaera mucosa]
MLKSRDIRELVRLTVMFTALGATSASVRADLITATFVGTVKDGPFAGTVAEGSFSYDTSVITVDQPCAYPGSPGFSVSLTIFGQTFTYLDDMDYPVRPFIQVADGVPVFLDFAISEAGNQGILGPAGNPTPIDQPGVAVIFLGGLSPATGGGYEVEVFVAAVPEPPASVQFACAGLGLAAFSVWKRRDRRRARPGMMWGAATPPS